MSAVELVVSLLVAVLGLVTVRVPEPLFQSIVFSMFGAALAVLFLVLQAPDVALSVMVVGLAYPLMILLALAKAKGRGR